MISKLPDRVSLPLPPDIEIVRIPLGTVIQICGPRPVSCTDNTEAAAVMQQELSSLIALSEKHLVPFLSNLKHSTWEAVRISGLGDIVRDSNEYRETTKTVQAGLESVSFVLPTRILPDRCQQWRTSR